VNAPQETTDNRVEGWSWAALMISRLSLRLLAIETRVEHLERTLDRLEGDRS